VRGPIEPGAPEWWSNRGTWDRAEVMALMLSGTSPWPLLTSDHFDDVAGGVERHVELWPTV